MRMNFIKCVAALGMSLALVACGGGGGSAGTPSGSPATAASAPASAASSPIEIAAAVPAIVEVLTSTNTLPSAGTEAVISAQVKNSANVGLSGKIVTFSASSGSMQLVSGVTDSNGIASAKLSAGGDKSNRNITVTATAAAVSGSIVVPVTGTKISIAGAGSLQSGSSASQFALRAVDSSGNGINNATLTIASRLLNGLSPTVVPTDPTGSATFIYTPTNAGTDNITVSGLGASASTAVVVSAIDFKVTAPSSNTAVPISSPQPITVQYKLSGNGVPGKTVNFSTTRGTVTSATDTTDGTGFATVIVSSATAGPATVTAQITGVGSVSLPLQFVAVTPASIVVQANPGSVLPNGAGSTTSQSTLTATVRDATGNPVAGQVVNFAATQDGSNGTIIPGSGTTDSNGITSVQFTPGALTTATNGVVVTASVQSNPALSSTATLTINGSALFISIAVSNTLTAPDTTTYQKDFSVYVTDADGAPAANRNVTISAFPLFYKKGFLNICTTQSADCIGGVIGWKYHATTSPYFCPNEDDISTNLSYRRNGIKDPDEDLNNNDLLDPGLPVVVSPSTLTTDTAGYATFTLRYGKNYAWWLTTQITARALVSGTESSKAIIYDLEMLSGDAAAIGNTPANVTSPFGIVTDCANKN